MARPPLLQPPISLSGAPPADLKPMVIEAARKGAGAAGIIGGAAVGAVFAYFVPKILDRALAARDGHGEPVELEVDDDG